MFCSISAVLSRDKLSLCDKIKGINNEINPTISRKKKINVVMVANVLGNRNLVFKKLMMGLPISVSINETIKYTITA
jgi:hypothetical protein